MHASILAQRIEISLNFKNIIVIVDDDNNSQWKNISNEKIENDEWHVNVVLNYKLISYNKCRFIDFSNLFKSKKWKCCEKNDEFWISKTCSKNSNYDQS